jgi:hypothetical protein
VLCKEEKRLVLLNLETGELKDMDLDVFTSGLLEQKLVFPAMGYSPLFQTAPAYDSITASFNTTNKGPKPIFFTTNT